MLGFAVVIFWILLQETYSLLSVVSVGCGIACSNLLLFFYRLVQISLAMRIVYYSALLHGGGFPPNY